MAGLQGEGEDPVRKRRKMLLCNNDLLLPPPPPPPPPDAAAADATVISSSSSLRFNDSVTADIDLSLYLYDDDESTTTNNIEDHEVHHLYLHSQVLLRRSQYFSTLLSDRWQRDSSSSSSTRYVDLTYKVPSSSSSMKSINTHLTVIELLYSTTDDDDDDDVNFSKTINTVSSALSILPVAIELLFEDCVKACIRLIEALPWTEEEEKRVLDLIPLLKEEESQELLSRLKIVSSSSSSSSDYEEKKMLRGLIRQMRLHHHQKDFVAKMLREFPSKDSVRFALYHEFEMSFQGFNDVLDSVSKSKSSHTIFLGMVAGRGSYLAWIIGRMIELRVADTALDRWIQQEGCSLTKNLQKVFSTHKGILPQYFHHVFGCTWELANAVATGSIVADRQLRMKLVKAWLPIVLCFKDMVFRIVPDQPLTGCEYEELLTGCEYEEPLFKILSTLPMSESQQLLIQCLEFGNNPNQQVNSYCCPHLEQAYKTWFRRAVNQPPKAS